MTPKSYNGVALKQRTSSFLCRQSCDHTFLFRDFLTPPVFKPRQLHRQIQWGQRKSWRQGSTRYTMEKWSVAWENISSEVVVVNNIRRATWKPALKEFPLQDRREETGAAEVGDFLFSIDQENRKIFQQVETHSFWVAVTDPANMRDNANKKVMGMVDMNVLICVTHKDNKWHLW